MHLSTSLAQTKYHPVLLNLKNRQLDGNLHTSTHTHTECIVIVAIVHTVAGWGNKMIPTI